MTLSTGRLVWILTRYRVRALLNLWRRTKPLGKVGLVALALPLFAFMALIGIGTGFSFRMVEQSVPGGGEVVAVTVLAGLSFLLLLTGVAIAFSTLFDDDTPMLLVAPCRTRSLVTAKLMGAFVADLTVIVILGVTPVIALGVVTGAGAAYYLFGLAPVIVLTWLISTATTLAALGIMRVVPRKRGKEMGAVLGGLAGALFGLIGPLVSRLTVQRPADPNDVAALLDRLAGTIGPLPWAWAGRSLWRAASGDWLGALAPFALLLGVTLAAHLLTLALAERAFAAALGKMMEGGGRVPRARQPRTQVTEGAGLLGRLLPSRAAAVAAKEWHTLRRDAQFWLTLLPVLIVLPLVLVINPAQEEPEFRNLTVILVVGLLPTTIATFTSAGAIGRERQAIWIARTAPVSAEEMMWGKFVGTAAVNYLLTVLTLSVLLALRLVELSSLPWLVLAAAPFVSGISGIALALGAKYPDFHPKKPQQFIRPSATLWFLFAGLGYGMVMFGLALGVVFAGRLSAFGGAVRVGAALLFLGVAALATVTPVISAARNFERLEV